MVQTERTVNPVIRQTANIITLSRLAAAGVLLFLTPFTPEFYAAYLWCGVSDMIDGTIARKTHSESRLGEKLDSAADVVFLIVCAVKLIPFLQLPVWLWIWIALIAAGKTAPLLLCAAHGSPQMVPHTIANKLTGFLLFSLPLLMRTVPVIVLASLAAAAATAAAVQDAVSFWKVRREGS